MKRSSDGVQRLLQVLARHADLVAEAFAGPVLGGDKAREAALVELMQVGALKPYDEGTYYLTSALHDYFAVSLASFHAYQSLTRIDGPIRQAESQWDELVVLKQDGSVRDMARLEIALQRSIIDIGDMVERNLQVLNTMVSGHYGNVDSFASKLRQNRFYAREVQKCLTELKKLESFIDRMADSALAAGQPRVRQLLRRRLGNQLFNWTSRLKDAQSVISRRLFEARLMERRLKQLARYASWLGANRTMRGWDIEVPAEADPALFRPDPVLVRPQPDILDPSPESLGRLILVAGKLKPAAPRARAAAGADEDTAVLSDTMEEVYAPAKPHQEALRRLLEHLATAGGPVSLIDWRNQDPELRSVAAENWLLYACLQLRARPIELRFMSPAVLEPFPVNETFHDVEVRARSAAAA